MLTMTDDEKKKKKQQQKKGQKHLTMNVFDGHAEGSTPGTLITVEGRVVEVPPQVVVVKDVVPAVVHAVAKRRHVRLRLATVAPDVAAGPPAGRLPVLQRAQQQLDQLQFPEQLRSVAEKNSNTTEKKNSIRHQAGRPLLSLVTSTIA